MQLTIPKFSNIVTCYTADVKEQFRQEANTSAFVIRHPTPIPFHLESAMGKAVLYKAADGTEAMGYEILAKKKKINGYL